MKRKYTPKEWYKIQRGRARACNDSEHGPLNGWAAKLIADNERPYNFPSLDASLVEYIKRQKAHRERMNASPPWPSYTPRPYDSKAKLGDAKHYISLRMRSRQR